MTALIQRETIRRTIRKGAIAVLGEPLARQIAAQRPNVAATVRSRLLPSGRANRLRVKSFQDKYPGGTCVIIGNGPSLNVTPLELLRGQHTFGLNRIYLMYDRLGFRPTFHVAINRYVVEQCADELAAIDSPLFTTQASRRHLGDSENVLYLPSLNKPHFSVGLVRGIWEGATVTYAAMQIAYYMGFRKVVLVGVDHSFAESGPPHALVESGGADRNHFDPNYFGKGFKWQLPDLVISEVAFGMAREAFARAGGEIVDATVGGKLEVFRKIELREALEA